MVKGKILLLMGGGRERERAARETSGRGQNRERESRLNTARAFCEKEQWVEEQREAGGEHRDRREHGEPEGEKELRIAG